MVQTGHFQVWDTVYVSPAAYVNRQGRRFSHPYFGWSKGSLNLETADKPTETFRFSLFRKGNNLQLKRLAGDGNRSARSKKRVVKKAPPGSSRIISGHTHSGRLNAIIPHLEHHQAIWDFYDPVRTPIVNTLVFPWLVQLLEGQLIELRKLKGNI